MQYKTVGYMYHASCLTSYQYMLIMHCEKIWKGWKTTWPHSSEQVFTPQREMQWVGAALC